MQLVGRGAELRVLARLVNDVGAGGRAVVTVEGEPGIGKTRLLRELCDQASAAGFMVLVGRGAELERDLPFGLAIDALDEPLGALEPAELNRLGEERLAELGAVLPSLANTGGPLLTTLEVERYRAHHAVRVALEQLASSRPVLLALDDVHWADPASTELVSHLLRRPVRRLLLALAYRPRQAPRRLASAVASAAREGGVSSVELGPLTVEDAARLLGDAVDASRIDALYAESGGNPFYLQELARAPEALMRQALTRDVDDTIPPAVRAAIAQELDQLSPDSRRWLQAAATVGQPFELELAAEIAGVDWQRALDAVDEASSCGLVRATDVPGRLVFRHPIVRRAVYDGAAPGWRLAAHARAAKALAERGAPISARAHHVERSAATGDEDAIDLLTQSGRAAVARAPAAAARWFEAAMRLLPTGAAPERRLSLTIPLANALAAVGRLDEVRSLLEQTLGEVPDGSHHRRTVTAMLAAAEQGLGRGEQARRLLSAAIRDAESGGSEAVALELALSENHLMFGEWDEAARTAAAAYGHAHALGDRALMVAAEVSRALAKVYSGDTIEANPLLDDAARSIDELRDSELTQQLLEALVNLCYAELAAERLVAAARHEERGVRLARETGQGYLFLRFTLGNAAGGLFRGRLSEARAAADAAAEAALLLGNDQYIATTEAQRCWVATTQGDLEGALRAGHDAVAAVERAPRSLWNWLSLVCYGEALVEAGEHERGRTWILAAGGPELEQVWPTARPVWQRVLVTAELAAGRLDAAEAVVRILDETADSLALASRKGDAGHARACVLIARGEFELAAHTALRAAEHYEAAGWRVWAGRARLEAGAALTQVGDTAAAQRELESAYMTFDACGAARLADRAAQQLRAVGRRVPRRRTHPRATAAGLSALTERERAVAERTARGATNRQIAAELFISEKTVETHLSHVFAKLDVSSRAAVAAVITQARQRGE